MQIRSEVNTSKNPKFDYFINLQNYLLKSEDPVVKILALNNISVIYQMLGHNENIKTIENLKAAEDKEIDDKIVDVKWRNINYLKIRKLNTILKYKSIVDIMSR